MVEHEQERASVGPRRGSGIWLAVAYYLIAGLIGVGAAAWLLLSTVTAIVSDGCASFSLMNSGEIFALGPTGLFAGAGMCEQRTDLLGLIVPSLVAGTLLPTARRLWGNPPRLGLVVGVGVVVGIAVAALPLIFIVWATNFYGFPPGPLEVIIFIGPFLWALASAVVVWRQAARQGKLRKLVVAGGGASLIVVVGGLLVTMVGGIAAASRPEITSSGGTMTFRLERPVEAADSGEALCSVGDGGEQLSVQRDGRLLVEGRPEFTVTVTAGDMLAQGSARREDGLEMWITLSDTDTGEAGQLWSTRDSILEVQREGASGSLRFARLAPSWGDLPSPLDTDLEGTIEWTCQSE